MGDARGGGCKADRGPRTEENLVEKGCAMEQEEGGGP